ncbi:MAG: DUF3526 domain-containing protein [Isosphaeraceae bacterium]
MTTRPLTNTVSPGVSIDSMRGETRIHPSWVVAKKEWLEVWRDSRWSVLCFITLALTFSAISLGLLRVGRLAHEREAAASGDRAVWTSQGAKNPHSAAHFGQYAFKPAGPLAVADPGVDDFAGNTVWLEAHKQNEVQFRSARDGTLMGRMGRLTLAYIFQVIMPLVAIMLGFSAFASEREKGTLRLLISLGVSPRSIFLGKLLSGSIVILLLLTIAIGSLFIALSLARGDGIHERDSSLRLLGLALGYGLYLLGFLSLSLTIAARARNCRSALVALLAYWILNCFVVPRVATDLVERAVDLPTAVAFRESIAEDRKRQFGHDETHPEFVAFRDRLLRQYNVKRVEDLPVSFRGLSLREDDERGYRIYDRHFGALQSRLARQDWLRAAPGVVFPLLALQPISMAMAGTDNRHQDHFVNEAERHRRRIQTAASQDLIDHARNGDTSYVAPRSLWEHIPSLQYERPPGSWAWKGQWLSLLSLTIWCGGCCLLGWIVSPSMRIEVAA